jgi:hypothetical protein
MFGSVPVGAESESERRQTPSCRKEGRVQPFVWQTHLQHPTACLSKQLEHNHIVLQAVDVFGEAKA